MPFIGLILFTAVTIRSAKLNDHDESHPQKYFWWSSLRLDTDPLNEHPATNVPCPDGKGNCASRYQLADRWIEPSLLDKAFVLSAIPVFLAGAALVIGLSKLGVDELLTFFVSMPILLFGWYLLRRLAHRALARSPCTHQKHSVEIRLSLRGICYPAAAALFDCIEAP